MSTVVYALFLLAWLIPSLTLHEFGHALMADKLGDSTAKRAGRLTLNPVPHIDPFGTVFMPGLLLLLVAFGRGAAFPVFAFAKPTPFNANNFKDPAKGTMWTAFAGPLVNLALAVVAALGTRATGGLEAIVLQGSYLALFFQAGLAINIILFVFNLMPIPGLDGSRVLARFLPPRAREVYRNMEQYLALFILLIVFIFPGPIRAIITGIGGGICELLGSPCF